MDIFFNASHLHLLLNHVPTVGTVAALGLFLLALVRRNEHLRHASLEVFFLIALLTLPVYLSGVAADRAIQGRPGISEPIIKAHHDAAILGFVLVMLTGAAAWLALWQFRRSARAARSTSLVVLLLAVLSLTLMGRAATLGGEIGHPEIRAGESATVEAAPLPGTAWITSGSITSFVNGSTWIWATAETLHFVGLCLSLGVLLLINLRLLGLMKAVPFAAVHRLLPWVLLGFGVNLVTGMLFFIPNADQYIHEGPFYLKIVFLMVAGANFLYLTVFDKTWALEADDDSRILDKAIAVSAIVAWLGVIYGGRFLPFATF